MSWIAPLLIGLVGVFAALAAPFAPVWAGQTTVQWPTPGAPTVSTTAFFAPYRPTELSVSVPGSVLRAAAGRAGASTVLATASGGGGLVLRVVGGSIQVLLSAHLVASVPVPNGQVTGASSGGIRVDAGTGETTIAAMGQAPVRIAGPAPTVARLHTDLTPAEARGLSVTARTSAVFNERATTTKAALIALWVASAAFALGWLWWRGRVPALAPRFSQPSATPTDRGGRSRPGLAEAKAAGSSAAVVVVDVLVGVVLAGWAVVGPLSDDDGFAAMIARNSLVAGFQGNYYRWWNASETPFALAQHLLAPLSTISLSPLWLRIPSTLLAVVTWLLLSRALLPTALDDMPRPLRVGLQHRPLADGPLVHARSWGVRLLSAVCFLVCWLPFNLGVRPEAYVAASLTAVLALLWRARTLWALGAAALVAGLGATTSPAAVVLAAPVVVFAPRIWRILVTGTRHWREVVANGALVSCLGAVTLVVVFADQSWHALAVATTWHTHFGPSLPWFDEFARYRYLLDADQDGTATKRVPVLLALTLLPVVTLVLAIRASHANRTTSPTPDTSAAVLESGVSRLGVVVALGLGLLWLTPSKWTHYFGALAGVFAALLIVAVLFLLRCAPRPEQNRQSMRDTNPRPGPATTSGAAVIGPARWSAWIGAIGSAAVAVAAGLAFSGPNAWWQPVLYDVPWAAGPIAPAGLPLNNPLLWVGIGILGYLWVRHREGNHAARAMLVAGPALLTVAVACASVAVLLVSFISAPLRQPSGSLALATVHQLTGTPSCGLGDDIQVLPDVAGSVMTPTTEDPGVAAGFAYDAGYDPSAPPPDPPGAGASAQLWGSLHADPDGALNTGTLTTPWFRLPAVPPGQEISVTVAGRTDTGNSLALQFGRSSLDGKVVALGSRTPQDPLRHPPEQPPTYKLWRTIGIPSNAAPTGADRIRILAADATSDPDGWLAVTGPRLRQTTTLRDYIARHSPVLVAWPIAFVFPCAVKPVEVHDGLAQAPVSVIEAPQQFSGLSAASTDDTIGGTFAPLREPGTLGEVTTRLNGRPDADWGNLMLTTYPDTRDDYQTTITWRKVSGFHGTDTTPAPPTRPSAP